MTPQTVFHMYPDEIKEMFREVVREQLAEKEPTEPDPNELWSSKEIADASGLKTETIARKLRELRDRKTGDVTTKGKYLAIPYKYIGKLELKYFKP